MKSGARRGFTIVEILIVIIVIAILATITAVMYTNAQDQARDLQVRDAAKTFADAVELFAAKNGRLPRGGSGSSVAIGSASECSNGVNGWAQSTGYVCTVEDTLTASGYLSPGFTAELPRNPIYPTYANRTLMLYTYGTNKAMVYYSQTSPTAADTALFNSELDRCGTTGATQNSLGMRGGICIQFR